MSKADASYGKKFFLRFNSSYTLISCVFTNLNLYNAILLFSLAFLITCRGHARDQKSLDGL